MIAVLKPGTTEQQIKSLTDWISSQGLSVHLSTGRYQTIVGLVGDTTRIDEDLFEELEELLICSDIGVSTTEEILETIDNY